MNAEKYIPVESECQESFIFITTSPVIISSPEQIITTSTHETTKMRAPYTQHSLVIHLLSIDYIPVFLAEYLKRNNLEILYGIQKCIYIIIQE